MAPSMPYIGTRRSVFTLSSLGFSSELSVAGLVSDEAAYACGLGSSSAERAAAVFSKPATNELVKAV